MSVWRDRNFADATLVSRVSISVWTPIACQFACRIVAVSRAIVLAAPTVITTDRVGFALAWSSSDFAFLTSAFGPNFLMLGSKKTVFGLYWPCAGVALPAKTRLTTAWRSIANESAFRKL